MMLFRGCWRRAGACIGRSRAAQHWNQGEACGGPDDVDNKAAAI